MNNMKKYLLLAVALSVVPSVAFASWWNPFTWNIFSSYQPNSQIQIISTTTPSDQTFIDNATTTATTTISTATATEVTVTTTSTPNTDIPVKKVFKKSIPSVSDLPAGMTLNQPPSVLTAPQKIQQTSSTQVPIITSFNNGIITGQHFTGVTGVYLYSIPLSGGISQRIDYNFVPQSDTAINVSGSYNVDDAGRPSPYFNLYVANTAGVSKPVVMYFSSLDSSQTTLSPQYDCYLKGMTKELQMLNDARAASTLPAGEASAVAAEQDSENLNSYQNALSVLCGTATPASQTNYQLYQIQNQLYHTQQTEQQAQQQAQEQQRQLQLQQQQAQQKMQDQLQQLQQAQQQAQQQTWMQQQQLQLQKQTPTQQKCTTQPYWDAGVLRYSTTCGTVNY